MELKLHLGAWLAYGVITLDQLYTFKSFIEWEEIPSSSKKSYPPLVQWIVTRSINKWASRERIETYPNAYIYAGISRINSISLFLTLEEQQILFNELQTEKFPHLKTA